jgi:hypothetical protein
MSLYIEETESAPPRDSVLRMVTADRRTYRDPRTTNAVQDVAAYLDDVVEALSAVGIRTSSIEIDARHPLKARLVVTEPGTRSTVLLDWDRRTGWWCARRPRLGVRPTGWRMVTGDPHATAADVARGFRHGLPLVTC